MVAKGGKRNIEGGGRLKLQLDKRKKFLRVITHQKATIKFIEIYLKCLTIRMASHVV